MDQQVTNHIGFPIALGAVGHAEWGVPLFGAGLLAWLAVESLSRYCGCFAEQLEVHHLQCQRNR